MEENLKHIRDSIRRYIFQIALEHDKPGVKIMDVAPESWSDTNDAFSVADVTSIDINDKFNPDIVADLCQNNSDKIPSHTFDVVICTDVLEHTKQPFLAAKEIARVLKTGGIAYISTPFRFRLHNPLPDCWRFTEYGLMELFSDFELIEMTKVGEWLDPYHIRIVVKK